MKRFSIALLLSTSMLYPAFADEFKFGSAVDAVTVFPRGAEVERFATGTIEAGTHTVLIENLPADISPDSVRVEGVTDGEISIGSVDVSQVFLSQADNSAERIDLELQLEAVGDEEQRLEFLIGDLAKQRTFLESLIQNAGQKRDDGNLSALSALEMAELLDSAGARLESFTERRLQARIEQRQVRRKRIELQNQIAALAPREERRSVVAINLNSQSAGQASFKLRYAIADAGWQPIYDAALTLGDGTAPALDIVRRANVRQSTSEGWEGVSLTLSTARPSMRTFAPELTPYEVSQLLPQPRKSVKMRSVEEGLMSYTQDSAGYSAGAPQLEAPAPIAREEVSVDFGGFQATYIIPGKVTISNTGETKSVVMGEESFDVAISAYTVPRLDATAYLIANFELAGQATYLPGQVLLSRDGVYIGRGTMPMLAPGDDYDLSFGQDDFVTVEHVVTDRKEGETGLISASLTDERRSKTTIKNLHGFPMKVKMVDRLPVSNHEDIKVAMLSGSTKPTVEDVDDKRGIVAWEVDVAAGGGSVIDFGYRITWPKAMQISQLD